MERAKSQELRANSPERKSRRRLRYLRRAALIALCLPVLGAAVWLLGWWSLAPVGVVFLLLGFMGRLGDNFRAVTPEKAYRSAQLSPERLKQVVQTHHIRRVLNLRGAQPGVDWYDGEAAACAETGAEHISIELKFRKLPGPKELAELISALEQGPYPLLWHCRAGADRSGLAAVLYLVIVEHQPFEQALKAQLSWRYGHVLWGKAAEMDRFFNLYTSSGAGMDLKTWILTRYPAVYEQEREKRQNRPN